MLRKKGVWIGLIALVLLVAGGGYVYYRTVYLPGQEAAEGVMGTAPVRKGDLVVSVSGSGTLVPAAETDLAFQAEGYLDEVLVEVGDEVQEGDVLARMEMGDLEMAVAEAEVNARLAQIDLDDTLEGPTDAELADARAAVQSARSSLLVAQYAYSSTLNSTLDSAVRARQIEYLWYVDHYWAAEDRREEGTISQEDYEQTWNDQAAAEWRFNTALQDAQLEDLEAQNQVAQANNSVYQAWENLQLLQTEPTTGTILRAELQTDQAVLALEEARADLEAAELRAPFDGTIVDVTAMPGEYIGTSAIITLSDLEEPVLCFWVEESDMSGVAVGHQVEITFEALPDEPFSGEVTRVDPALVQVDNTLAVQAWASIDLPSERVDLLSGLNADVEVISAEARDVLLVPVEALRELDSDRYAVFVVGQDGEVMLRPVEVGLQDLVYAEILSGLEFGEVVSTGVEERQETVVPEQEMPGGAGPGGAGPGGPGPGMPMIR